VEISTARVTTSGTMVAAIRGHGRKTGCMGRENSSGQTSGLTSDFTSTTKRKDMGR